MRKGYGTLLAVIVAFSVLAGPRPNTSAQRAVQTSPRKAEFGTSSAERFANENFTTCKTDADTEPPCKDCSPLCPAKNLLDAIQAHYGEAESSAARPGSEKPRNYRPDEHWGVPEGENTKILFVIATVPDPVYTHLSLFFDRNIEAITKGAQEAGFLFSRATMPWDGSEHPDTPDARVRVAQQTFQQHKEEFPGLMIFRRVRHAEDLLQPNNRKPKEYVEEAHALFVLVVGETPTGGIRKDQFKNALRLIRGIRGKDTIPDNLKLLRILGTTFSGSLASLEQIWDQELGERTRGEFPRILIHSGTASSLASTEEFRDFLKVGHKNAEFATFQESDQYADEHFCAYMKNQDYDASEIAILSEDETAYGNILSNADGASESGDERETIREGAKSAKEPASCVGNQVVHLYFPRNISQLRAAYQRELKAQESAANAKNAPQTTLPLNLDTTGSDGDSVSTYATLHTPLSQESVLLGVVANLKKHHIRVVVLRATSSLDTLFLCQFLRTAYADARIVTIGSDLLYQRDFDKPNLHGVLSITSYPLLPGIDDEVAALSAPQGNEHEDRVFSDNYSVGIFNALLSLIAEKTALPKTEEEKKSLPLSSEHRRMILPEANYEQYGWPALPHMKEKDGENKASAHGLTPPLWLTVNGRGGAWPLAILDENAEQNAKPESNLYAVAVKEPVPGSPHTSPALEWQVAGILSLGLAAIFSWFMAIPPRFPRSQALTTFRSDEDDYRDRLLFASGWLLLGTQLVFLYPWLYWGGIHQKEAQLFWAPALAMVAVTGGCSLGLQLRGSRRLAIGFLASAAAAILVLLVLRFYPSAGTLSASRHFLLYRSTHLGSGNSPLLPILLLLAAGMWWCWMSLQGIILRGKKGPCLPDEQEFENAPGLSSCMDRLRLKNLTCQLQTGLLKSLKPLGVEPRVLLPAIFVAGLIFLVLGWKHPVQALDGDHYEDFYGLLLLVALFFLLTLIFRLVLIWIEFRSLLRTLEDLPLRRSFDRLKGFAWQSLWRLAGSAGSGLVNFYRLLSRELDSLNKFLKLKAVSPASPAEPASYANFVENINVTERKANELCEAFVKTGHHRKFWERHEHSWQDLLESFHAQLAKTCAAALVYLTGKWNSERCANAEELKEEQKRECEAAAEGKKLFEPIPCPLTACAERFVCLFFLAHILVILQRIQTLVLSCVGLFLFVLMSVNSYPFEPHLRLRSLLIALFFLILGGVGLVYSGMHRDATLSRITDTKPGELGVAFWIRMGTFLILPTLGLLAAQFPEINSFLFSWLEPAAESLK